MVLMKTLQKVPNVMLMMALQKVPNVVLMMALKKVPLDPHAFFFVDDPPL